MPAGHCFEQRRRRAGELGLAQALPNARLVTSVRVCAACRAAGAGLRHSGLFASQPRASMALLPQNHSRKHALQVRGNAARGAWLPGRPLVPFSRDGCSSSSIRGTNSKHRAWADQREALWCASARAGDRFQSLQPASLARQTPPPPSGMAGCVLGRVKGEMMPFLPGLVLAARNRRGTAPWRSEAARVSGTAPTRLAAIYM